ncbi:acyltransferase family protein [Plantactinospora endophytica]|uniref:acyltransferase family protein n=1 Tax=Plantactinospora endophytica TaxID=673535 RepID=UPI00194567FC|nr:acyltransferase [Plantactinospora endophytica]
MSASANPPTTSRLPALDVLRAVGAAGVVGHHVGFATGVTVNAGWGGWLARLDVGVALFFLLSGFLLFRPYALAAATGERRPATSRYLWRRAVRILPAYWLAVGVCLLLLAPRGPAPLADWLRHLTFTQIYQPGQLRAGLAQTWSLATEVAFYLLLPALAGLALGRRRWRPVRAVVVTAAGIAVTAAWIAAMAAGWLDLGLHTMWLPAYGGWFGGGMALAVVHVALRTGTAPPGWRLLDDLGAAPLACWSVALGLFAVATTPLAGPRDLAEPTAGEFGTKLMLYLAIAVLLMLPLAFGPGTAVRDAVSLPLARGLGAVSYGLFLWHPLVLESIYLGTGRPTFTGDLLTTFTLTLLGGLLLGTLSYALVERPLLRVAARWPGRSGRGGGSARPAGTGRTGRWSGRFGRRLGSTADSQSATTLVSPKS